MSHRTDKLRRGIAAVQSGRLEEERPEIYAFAEDASYHIPFRGVSLHGRSDIEASLKALAGALTMTVGDMVENGRLVLAAVDIDSKVPGMEYQGPAAAVWRFDEDDQIAEQWTFRGD